MKKICIWIAIAIIGIGSCCSVVNANEDIVDLGTIQYSNTSEKILIVEIESNISIDLNYITSDLDNKSLYIDSTWFSPLENKTTYVFATVQVDADWWFTNDTKMFLYQDNTTKQLYKININYSDIEIPSNPVIELQNRYDLLNISYCVIYDIYNNTIIIYNTTRDELQELELLYNYSKQDFDNNSALVKALKDELITKGIEFNETEVLWIDATTNVSTLELHIEQQKNDYDELKKKHDNLGGALPWYIIITIIGSYLVTYTYIKRKTVFNPQQDPTDEITTGYGKIHSAIDKHVLSRLRRKPITTDKGGIEEITEQKEELPVEKEKIAPVETDDKEKILAVVHEKIDANNRAINTKIDTSFKDMNEKIDNLIEKTKTS